jgi:hypothetical protein
MKIFNRVMLAVVAITAVTAVLSMTADAFTVRGIGTAKCSEWRKQKANSSDDYLFQSWIVGFTSVIESVRHSPREEGSSNKIVNATILRWADDYCKNNPTDLVAAAAQASASKLEATIEETPVPMVPETTNTNTPRYPGQ